MRQSETISVLFSDSAIYNGNAPAETPAADIEISEDVTTIETGSIGNEVLSLQQRLYELGYYISRLDGVYLDDDMEAVMLFQEINGLTVDGKAGYDTLKLLFSDDAKAAPEDAISEETTYATLRYGDSGNDVALMQERLIELGYLDGDADGKYGLQTKAAVIAFQRESDLVRDGVAGSKTLAALYSDSAAQLDTSETLTEGTISSAVRQMQERLIALGYLNGTARRYIRSGNKPCADCIPERTKPDSGWYCREAYLDCIGRRIAGSGGCGNRGSIARHFRRD